MLRVQPVVCSTRRWSNAWSNEIGFVMLLGARDLKRKLRQFREYNHDRVHASLNGATPVCSTDRHVIALDDYRLQSHCRGLYELPAAA